MTTSVSVQASIPLAGSAVVNAEGVPGTVGFIALTLHESRPVLVTTHHALFGGGARTSAPVFAGSRAADGDDVRVGVSGWSRRGTVRYDAHAVHVDCGVVVLDEALERMVAAVDELGTASARVGMSVTKIGAASGRTAGTIVDAAYDADVRIDGRATSAPGQILIRGREQRFSARGDSGAAVMDESGAIVGVLWGVAPSGDAVACPIAPVLWLLNVRPVRVPASAAQDVG